MPISMPKVLENKHTQIVLAIIVVVLLLWWINRPSNESFNQESKSQEQYVVPEHIEPSYYDSETGTMMTSPDFIPQSFEPAWGSSSDSQANFDSPNFKDKIGVMERATDLGDETLAFNYCSKSCCADQYPTPFNMPTNANVCKNKGDFVPSSYTCNNAWEDTGCLCMTKNQSEMLATRAGNL